MHILSLHFGMLPAAHVLLAHLLSVLMPTLIPLSAQRNADLEAFMFEGASVKTCRAMLETLISTRQIMQQSGLRNYNGEPNRQVLYG